MNASHNTMLVNMSWWKRWILVVALLLVVSPVQSLAAEASETSTDGEIDLYSLSDAELEEICTVRGFELVHDTAENNGQAFTHDDYVEAARQCLAIEQDMEEIIAEHPEILGELEQERDRMMLEKERLEQELAEAEKRADGRQHHHDEESKPHAAIVSHTEEPEEIVDLDEQEEEDFDVIGHQEPLSDSRVHEEQKQEETTTTTTSNDDAVSQPQQVTQQEEESPLTLGTTIHEFKERIVSDFMKVADVVFPKQMRGPTKQALQRFGRILKREAINVYKFLKRYVKAFIEKRKNTTDENESGAAANSGGIPTSVEPESAA